MEEIIGKLRKADVAMGHGESVAQASRRIGVSTNPFSRWRQEDGGLRRYQAKRLQEMETEHGQLRRGVADLTLDTQILKEAARGNR